MRRNTSSCRAGGTLTFSGSAASLVALAPLAAVSKTSHVGSCRFVVYLAWFEVQWLLDDLTMIGDNDLLIQARNCSYFLAHWLQLLHDCHQALAEAAF